MESFLELPCETGEDYDCEDCDRFGGCDMLSDEPAGLDLEDEEEL